MAKTDECRCYYCDRVGDWACYVRPYRGHLHVCPQCVWFEDLQQPVGTRFSACGDGAR